MRMWLYDTKIWYCNVRLKSEGEKRGEENGRGEDEVT